jgi:hypothetical protein
MRTLLKGTIILSATLASGCASDDYQRMDGMTFGAGNAMAANTAMQMVDPWPSGVQNTKLRVPAVRGTQPGAADEAAGEKESQGGATSD